MDTRFKLEEVYDKYKTQLGNLFCISDEASGIKIDSKKNTMSMSFACVKSTDAQKINFDLDVVFSATGSVAISSSYRELLKNEKNSIENYQGQTRVPHLHATNSKFTLTHNSLFPKDGATYDFLKSPDDDFILRWARALVIQKINKYLATSIPQPEDARVSETLEMFKDNESYLKPDASNYPAKGKWSPTAFSESTYQKSKSEPSVRASVRICQTKAW